MRMCVGIVACAAAGVIVAAAGAAGKVTATLTTSSKAPRAGQVWRWTIAARDDDGPAAVRVRLQMVRGTRVVGCFETRPATTMLTFTSCHDATGGNLVTFTGSHTGLVRWPQSVNGAPFTFHAVVLTRAGTLHLRAPVDVLVPKPAAKTVATPAKTA